MAISGRDRAIIENLRADKATSDRQLEELIKEYWSELERRGRNKFPSLHSSDVETAMIDSFLGLQKSVRNESFKLDTALEPYLKGIFFRKLTDAAKKNKTDTIEVKDYMAFDTPDVMTEEDKKDAVVKCKVFLNLLDEKCRNILMQVLKEYDYEEIAFRNGLKNRDVVRQAKYQCLEKLRKIIKRHEQQGE